MITYVAFLRGINVGGKNIIKMTELKKVFEAIGAANVKTYIQSGNVVFKSIEDEEALRNKLEQEIKDAFGIKISVVLRTAEELGDILLNCPFSQTEISGAELSSGVESLYVALLNNEPPESKVELLNSYRGDHEDIKIVGRNGFLLFRNSIRNSKLTNHLQKLDVSATVRNWKTISRLVLMAKELQGS